MIDYSAQTILGTTSRARINTFLIETRFSSQAVWINYTFRSACRWTTHISQNTGTDTLSVNISTYWIWPTRRRVTWILWALFDYGCLIKEELKDVKSTELIKKNVRCTGRHCINALPSIPWGQLHIGRWFITSHTAFCAQTPMQGSTHFRLMQALFRGHSELRTHSGRQPT